MEIMKGNQIEILVLKVQLRWKFHWRNSKTDVNKQKIESLSLNIEQLKWLEKKEKRM